MKELLNGLAKLPKAIGLLLQALYNVGHAIKTYSQVHRIKSAKQLYDLLHNKKNLTYDEQMELERLIKEYQSTLKPKRVNKDEPTVQDKLSDE